MTAYVIRYRPGTWLGERFPEPATWAFATRAEAESLMARCINAEHMEVVES